MELIVKNNNGIIRNAFIEYSKSNMSFSLYINTEDKWRFYDMRLSGYDSYQFIYTKYDNQDYEEADSVEIIASNEEEIEILRRINFELLDKDQLWIIYLDETVYN